MDAVYRSCPDVPEVCDPTWAMMQPGPNPQTLWGAVVGGPALVSHLATDSQNYLRQLATSDDC